MEGKKSFILYVDLINTVDKLPNDKAGELFKIILEYVNDKNPVVSDLLLQIAFEPIKLQLKRDLKDWRDERKKRSEAGRKGGKNSGKSRAAKQNEAKRSSASKKEANEADNVTVTVTVNDTVTVINKKDAFDLFWDLYEKKVDREKCFEIWMKLKAEEIEEMIPRIKAYVISTPEKKYRKNPKTYLYNKSWQNELPSAAPNGVDKIKFRHCLGETIYMTQEKYDKHPNKTEFTRVA